MKVSELWLKDLIDTDLSFNALADKLTDAGIEVESISQDADSDNRVMDLKIPPNRGDCLSMEGIARELAVLTSGSFNPKKYETLELSKSDNTYNIKVQVEDDKICPRYTGRIIRNIKNLKSPSWLTTHLEVAGIRSISPIVDVMNYVMLEMGQPMHAFDLDKIQSEIIIRKGKSGEEIELLDRKKIKVDENTLLITDKNTPIAIAGIMGGYDSSVSSSTHSIFIESAYFDPISIRQTAKKYNMKTDSSYRFERGIDPTLQRRALERASSLIISLFGGIAGPIIEVKNETVIPKNPTINVRTSTIKKILGLDIAPKEIETILKRAHMKLEQTENGFLVQAPAFRHDIQGEEDLLEEIARIYGFEKFKAIPPTISLENHLIPESRISTLEIKKILRDRGYREAITYSFIDPDHHAIFKFSEEALELANPISNEMKLMRTSLIPGLLKTIQYNQNRSIQRAHLFEIGLCFSKQKNQTNQIAKLGGVCFGLLYQEQWGIKKNPLDFYDVKKDIEAIFELGGNQTSISFEKSDSAVCHPGFAAKILFNNTEIGFCGALHPEILSKLELEKPIIIFELDLTYCKTARLPQFHSLSKFPAIRRDIAIVLPKEILASHLKSAILNKSGELLRELFIFDVYDGKGIEPGKKSIALGLLIQHPSKTLVEEEINQVVQNVVQIVTKNFQATLRE